MTAALLALVMGLSGDSPLEQLTNEFKTIGSRIEQVALVRTLNLTRDAARFTLKDGVLCLLGSVGHRKVAVVFVGNGAIELVPPLAVERGEMQRLMGDTALTSGFNSAVFIFADSTAEELGRQVSFGPIAQATDPKADRGQVSSRVGDALDYVIDRGSKQMAVGLLSALLNGRPNAYFSAFLTRTDKESVSIAINPYAAEGFSIRRKGRYQYQNTQTVAQFPLAPDLADSSETKASHDPLEIKGYEIETTIKDNYAFSAVAGIKVAPRAANDRWFLFELTSILEVDSVTNAAGRPLAFYRPHNQFDLWVQLDSMAAPGTEQVVRVTYHGPLLASGSVVKQFMPRLPLREALQQPVVNDRWVFLKETSFWFPRHGEESVDFALTFHTPSDVKFATIGRLVDQKTVGKVTTTKWVSERPARNVSFNLGEFEEFKIKDPRIPPVTVHINSEAHRQMRSVLIGQADPAQQVGGDVANSLSFFSRVYGPPLFQQYFATEIPYGHGEAFPGLIHLSWWTFQTLEDKGESEVFRAHEMAHQWWGIGIQPRTYRDRWMSEGFADFSGLWYMQLILRDNEKYFKQLDEFKKELFDLKDSPALGIGTRIGAANPEAYWVIVYKKGAWVLHMIRNMMLNLRTMNEEAFAKMMADFYQTYRGKKASTEDFQAIVEKHMGIGVGWFFHDWFDYAALPTYVFSWHADPLPNGKAMLKFKVRQEGVPEDFFMPVPLKIEFADVTTAMIRVNVRGKEVAGELEVPGVPARLELNPLQSVLARVKEEGWKQK